MKRGQTKRAWTPEQQAEIVHKHLDEHISVRTLKKLMKNAGVRALFCAHSGIFFLYFVDLLSSSLTAKGKMPRKYL